MEKPARCACLLFSRHGQARFCPEPRPVIGAFFAEFFLYILCHTLESHHTCSSGRDRSSIQASSNSGHMACDGEADSGSGDRVGDGMAASSGDIIGLTSVVFRPTEVFCHRRICPLMKVRCGWLMCLEWLCPYLRFPYRKCLRQELQTFIKRHGVAAVCWETDILQDIRNKNQNGPLG